MPRIFATPVGLQSSSQRSPVLLLGERPELFQLCPEQQVSSPRSWFPALGARTGELRGGTERTAPRRGSSEARTLAGLQYPPNLSTPLQEVSWGEGREEITKC